MTPQPLESITGDLLAYKQLEPDSMLHGYEITTELRTCPDEALRRELRNNPFYTADGQLYTAQQGEVLWGITKLPQNVVLRNLDEACRQLTQTGNYFPPVDEARVSFEHADTMVVDLKGLELTKSNNEFGYFVIHPEEVSKLNSEQKRAAQRLFGPDEESFGLNMEMLGEAGKLPRVFVLLSDYVQDTLNVQGKPYLGRASWWDNVGSNSYFIAYDRDVDSRCRVVGVRLGEARSAAPEKLRVPAILQTTAAELERKKAYLEEILAFTRQGGFIAERIWKDYEAELKEMIIRKK